MRPATAQAARQRHEPQFELREAQCTPLVERIDIAVERQRVAYVSFDIFDTVLTRGAESERRRFLITAERLLAEHGPKLPGVTVHDLYAARVTAAQLAYRFTPHKEGSREASIREIYDCLLALIGCDRTWRDELVDTELRLEADMLAPNRAVIGTIERLRDRGIAVELVTDMYLEARDIRRLFELLEVPRWLQEIPIWSSAEAKYTKSNGRLFRHIASTRGIAFERMLHVGDNGAGEIVPAYKLGLNVVHLPLTNECLEARRRDELAIIAQQGI